MPDYNKLTVVKLREELVKRGLPKTGLKPVLVNRLLEADAQTEIQDATPDVPLSVVPAVQEESYTQIEPSNPSQTHTKDRGGVDEKSVHADMPEHKLTGATDNGSLQQREPLDEASEIRRETERSLDAPVKTVEEVSPEIGAFSKSQIKTDARDANLPGPESTDTAAAEPLMPTSDATLETKSHDQPSDQTQESIQTTAFSHPPAPKPLEQAAEQVPEEVLRVIQTKETFQMVEILEQREGAPGEAIKVVKTTQQKTSPDDMGKNIEEVQEKESRRRPDVDENVVSGSAFQDDEARIGAEALEDNKKRKRRSQSPPPLTEDIAQKRARMDDSKLSVILHEDSLMRDMADSRAKEPEDTIMADPIPSDLAENGHMDGHTQPPEKDNARGRTSGPNEAPQPLLPSKGPESPKDKELQPNSSDENPTQTQSGDIAAKPSPHDTRFKKLFSAPPNRSGSPDRQAAYGEDEDRSISPALHLATGALYIRNFMRPLHSSLLKDHLIALATPVPPSPSASPSSQIITEFFLDPIRTHCLVGFTSTAAASRVRSSLHNRVWPDERTRRPLWVDFVPEEKLQKWIDVEKDVGSQRSQGAKRWEVVYEEEEGHIKAYLQEVGSGSGPPPSHPSSRPKPDALQAPPGVTGAPLGPRSRAIEAPRPVQQQKQALAQQADVGKGFQALDDLFQSTTAKPKLYYLPVSKAVADKRLEQLEEGKGGGRSGNEIRKYTFEGEVLVDRGAEFGGRARGGYGGWRRGRGGGGGGGGGYRGEGWRERDRERNGVRERDEGLRERARREAWREKDRGDSFRERDRPGAWRERDRDGGWRGAR